MSGSPTETTKNGPIVRHDRAPADPGALGRPRRSFRPGAWRKLRLLVHVVANDARRLEGRAARGKARLLPLDREGRATARWYSAYEGDIAVGWCAVGPRKTLPQFNRSRVASPIEDIEGVFAVNCFYVRAGRRGQKLMRRLLEGAVKFAASRGAAAIEACPIDTQRKLVWGEGYVGIASVFRDAGFSEVARRSPTRPLMRKAIGRMKASVKTG